MSSFTHHRRRQTLVQICSSSVVMISTFRSQGEAACSCQTFPNIFCLDLKSFSSPHTNSLSHTHTYCLWLSQSVILMHTINAAGMCDVDTMRPRLVLLHSAPNPPGLGFAFTVWCGRDSTPGSPVRISHRLVMFSQGEECKIMCLNELSHN